MKLENNIIELPERITVDNSKEVFDEIKSMVGTNSLDNLILDASKLEYLSSMGLRGFLNLKKQLDIKVINTSNEVYDVFELTGFTTLFPVEKRLRKQSIEGLKEIGRGQTGQVYKIDDETIIKCFNSNITHSYIEEEKLNAQKALLAGIPTAISFDIVDVNGREGIVYELLNAHSYNELLKNDPENRSKYIKEFAKFMKQVHETEMDDSEFEDKKKGALAFFDEEAKNILTPEEIEKTKKLYEIIPDRHTCIHGDFNFGNLMNSDEGPMLIDMHHVGYGHPLIELSSFYTYLKLPTETIGSSKRISGFTDEEASELFDEFIRAYLDTDDEDFIKEVVNEIRLRSEFLALKTGSYVPDFFSKEDLNRFKNDYLEAIDAGLKPIEF